MINRTHKPVSTQQEVSDMLKRLKLLRDTYGYNIQYFISSVGTIKVPVYKSGKTQWMMYNEAEKYIPMLRLNNNEN